MALLIPSFMDDTTPPGERDLFNLLSNAPDDWVVLHSLDLSPWNRSRRTEIDFLVIIPKTGILCIEVKSHLAITFRDGQWFPPEIRRSPFKQVADARYSFHRRLSEIAHQFKNLPVAHLCIFPRASFEVRANLAVQPWELIDGRCFRTFSRGEELATELQHRLELSINADQTLHPMAKPLTRDQVEAIVHFCLPVQKRRPDARDEILQLELEVDRVLRDQQKSLLQLAGMNDRLLISGGAGTGKTLIAMEVARRAAGSGRRVALLCFNQLVGDWMKDRMISSECPLPNLVVGRAIQVMTQLTDIQIPSHPSSDFWETEMIEKLEEGLTDPAVSAASSFDYLVIDEAQDLLARPRLWQCVLQLLIGGLGNGSFALFGDFENQVLKDRFSMDQSLSALNTTANPTRFRLSENCRNYRIVGETAVGLSGIESGVYSGYLRAGGGVQNFDITYYENDRAQLDQLIGWLKEFKSKGYKPSEISILSLCNPGDGAAARLVREGFRLREAWQAGMDTGYSSIQAFKGMENKVVILSDLVFDGQDNQRNLLYTGMTRAVESVRLLCEKRSQQTLNRWLSGRVQNE